MTRRQLSFWTIYLPHWISGAVALFVIAMWPSYGGTAVAIQIAFQVGMLIGSVLNDVRSGDIVDRDVKPENVPHDAAEGA